MSEQKEKTDRFSWLTLVMPGLFTFFAMILLISLGIWQLQRLAWKDELIARIDARTHAQPVTIVPERDWPTLQWKDEEYRPVQVAGQYLYDRQVFVHGNAELGAGRVLMGYFVLTPLRQDDNSIVIINRGFIPMELKLNADAFQQWQAQDQQSERVTVAGLLRAPQERGWFVPDDVPTSNEWFTRDPFAIANSQNLTRVAPFIIDAFSDKADGKWPIGGLTVVNFPNNHLDYAFTWFGLALALLIIFLIFALKKYTLRGSRLSDK